MVLSTNFAKSSAFNKKRPLQHDKHRCSGLAIKILFVCPGLRGDGFKILANLYSLGAALLAHAAAYAVLRAPERGYVLIILRGGSLVLVALIVVPNAEYLRNLNAARTGQAVFAACAAVVGPGLKRGYGSIKGNLFAVGERLVGREG